MDTKTNERGAMLETNTVPRLLNDIYTIILRILYVDEQCWNSNVETTANVFE